MLRRDWQPAWQVWPRSPFLVGGSPFLPGIERRGLEPNNLQIPDEKPRFQNEVAQNPTRAVKNGNALAAHSVINSPRSEL